MAEEVKVGCARPVSKNKAKETAVEETVLEKKEEMQMIKVGKPGKTTLRPGLELVGNVWKEWKVEEAFED